MGLTTAEPAALADEGVSASFEEFYRAHLDRVYRALAITLGSDDLAREATDEAMARA
jgi:DNA-directed RNA polymerase specialized sigma24 family protein